HLVLLVDRRLGRVEVFRPLVVVIELARTEADRRSRHVADGPDQAPAEAIVGAALPLCDEARRRELLGGEALRGERAQHPVPTARGVSDAEMRRRSRIETTLAQKSARRLSLLREQLL